MLYLDPAALGTNPSVTLVPPPSDVNALEAALNGESGVLPTSQIALHLGFLAEGAAVDIADGVLRRLASEMPALLKGRVTSVARIGIEGDKPFVLALVVESSDLEDLHQHLIEAMEDAEVDYDPGSEIALHLPLVLYAEIGNSESSLGQKLEELIGTEIAFDHFSVKGPDEEVTHPLGKEGEHEDLYYITESHPDCDGFAVVDSRNKALVCCHSNRTTAAEAMRRKVEEEARSSSSGLVRLSAEETTSVEKAEAGTGTGLIMGAGDTRQQADWAASHERQMARLMGATPDLIGPAVYTGEETGDRRIIHYSALRNSAGEINMRKLPLPFMYGTERAERHLKAALAGWITKVEVVPSDDGINFALFVHIKLNETPLGEEVYGAYHRGEFRGVSADMDRSTGIELEVGSVVDGGPLVVITQARLMGLTAVPFPALEKAGLWTYEGDPGAPQETSLVASGADHYAPRNKLWTPSAERFWNSGQKGEM